MALKSKEWFYKHCLDELTSVSPLAHLAKSALAKGVGQQDSARGHVTQAIGALQGFLAAYPGHRTTVKAADPTVPYDINGDPQMLADWNAWFAGCGGAYGREDFGYSYDTLRGLLTRTLGGTRTGGGGGNDEFKRVLRLLPEFWGRS